MSSGWRFSRGFTLLELLVVIGLVAGISLFLLQAIFSGRANSLQSGQAQIANLISAARMKAAATGKRTRLLVHVDPVSNPDRRFLRFYVYQLGSENSSAPSAWTTIDSGYLPENIFFVPGSLTLAGGLVSDRTQWKKTSAAAEDLVSDMLVQTNALTIPGDTAPQTWAGFVFTPQGTLAPLNGSGAPKGNLVLATGVVRAPNSMASGESPVRLQDPASVRGMAFSVYGVPTLLNDQTAF